MDGSPKSKLYVAVCAQMFTAYFFHYPLIFQQNVSVQLMVLLVERLVVLTVRDFITSATQEMVHVTLVVNWATSHHSATQVI